MLLPTGFKTAIANTFYDKSFTISRRTRSKDAEGGEVIATTQVGSYVGNIQPGVSSGVRQSLGIELRGLVDDTSLSVTTSNDTDAKTDDVLTYNGNEFAVKGAYQFDSHLLLVCESL